MYLVSAIYLKKETLESTTIKEPTAHVSILCITQQKKEKKSDLVGKESVGQR